MLIIQDKEEKKQPDTGFWPWPDPQPERPGDRPGALMPQRGEKGDPGAAASVTIGTVTTLEPGEDATVTNVGTDYDAILNFGIPKGEPADEEELEALTAKTNEIKEDLGDFEKSVFPLSGAGNFTWTLGKTVNASGVVSANNSTAITGVFHVNGSEHIKNASNKLGMNGKETILHVNQYIGGAWQSRTVVENGKWIRLNSETNGVRITFGYAAAAHNVETQDDVDDNFSVLISGEFATKEYVGNSIKEVPVTSIVGNMIEVAESYFDAAYAGNLVYRGERTPFTSKTIDNIADYETEASLIKGYKYYPPTNKSGIQCSGFVNALVKGLPYEKSRYCLDYNIYAPWAWYTDGVLPAPKTGFAYDFMWSYEFARYLHKRGLLREIDHSEGNTANFARPGDIVFECYGAEGTIEERISAIGHIAMIINSETYTDSDGLQHKTVGVIESWNVAEAGTGTTTIDGVEYQNWVRKRGVRINKDNLTRFDFIATIPNFAEPAYKTNLVYSDTRSSSSNGESKQIAYKADGVSLPKGMYTIVIHGDSKLNNRTVVRLDYGSNVEFIDICKSNDRSIATFYASAEFSFRVHNLTDETDRYYYDFTGFELYRGYYPIEQAAGYVDITGKLNAPSGGTEGQVLTKTKSGAEWQTPSAGGAVSSVNGQTGAVVLSASDVGALPDSTVIPSAVTESTVTGWGFTKNTGTYSKPTAGIPKTDLASAVQTSLGKADTALQSLPTHSHEQSDITGLSTALAGKADASNVYTKQEIDDRIGVIDSLADLLIEAVGV